MGVNSLPKPVTRQRRDCDLKPGPSAPESSTLATRLRDRVNGKRAIEAAVSFPFCLESVLARAVCLDR